MTQLFFSHLNPLISLSSLLFSSFLFTFIPFPLEFQSFSLSLSFALFSSSSSQHQDCRGQVTVEEYLIWEDQSTAKRR